MPITRRALIRGLALGGVGLVAGCRPAPSQSMGTAAGPITTLPQPDLADDVRAEFLHTYQGYLRFASGYDELRPVEAAGSDFFAPGRPVALTTIESLDTLYLMELDEELDAAVQFVATEVSFDLDADFQVFEAIIRLVGGLLSGYHATRDERLLDRARDLAARLMPAFEQSPTGMPYRFVNLRTGEVSGNVNVLAEIGTNITEFGDLSRQTGDDRYVQAARRAQQAVYDRRSPLGLVGSEIDVESGQWTNGTSTINPPVDSFYEYLFEAYYLLGDREALSWYQTLTEAIVARSVEIDGDVWFPSVDMESGEQTSVAQSELASFYAGLLAQADDLELGRRYHDSWNRVLDEGFRILPEGYDPSSRSVTERGNQLRPEYVDSAFHLWLVTGDPIYVERAIEYYENMKATSRAEHGYTILTDVTTRPEQQGDLTPGYWYSENMKYYWLMFQRAERFDYDDNYLTTEGNVLRGLIGRDSLG